MLHFQRSAKLLFSFDTFFFLYIWNISVINRFFFIFHYDEHFISLWNTLAKAIFINLGVLCFPDILLSVCFFYFVPAPHHKKRYLTYYIQVCTAFCLRVHI